MLVFQFLLGHVGLYQTLSVLSGICSCVPTYLTHVFLIFSVFFFFYLFFFKFFFYDLPGEPYGCLQTTLVGGLICLMCLANAVWMGGAHQAFRQTIIKYPLNYLLQDRAGGVWACDLYQVCEPKVWGNHEWIEAVCGSQYELCLQWGCNSERKGWVKTSSPCMLFICSFVLHRLEKTGRGLYQLLKVVNAVGNWTCVHLHVNHLLYQCAVDPDSIAYHITIYKRPCLCPRLLISWFKYVFVKPEIVIIYDLIHEEQETDNHLWTAVIPHWPYNEMKDLGRRLILHFCHT